MPSGRVRSKYEGSGDKETHGKRDSSTSRLSKEKLQKEDVRTKTRVREKLATLRSETEKMKRPGAVQARDSHSTTREVKPKTTKPAQSVSRSERKTPVSSITNAAAAPAEKPVITVSSRESIRKSKEESVKPQVRRKETSQQSSARKELLQTAKLPDRMSHPQKIDRSRNRTPQAQKVEEPKPRLGRDRTRTRTLSPTEVKVAKGEPHDNKPRTESKKQKDVENPHAAPMTAGPSIVQSHDQGAGDNAKVQENDDYDYEDDFEDYESDFEEASSDSETSDEAADVKHTGYTSSGSDTESDSESVVVELTPRQPVVEEEKKLDSGNYDLAERRRKGREMQEIKLAMERENEALKEKRNFHAVEAQAIADDEGFEEGKSADRKKFSSTSISLINFVGARKRKQEKKATANARRRGEELLGMIQLDSMSFTLFDLPPIPYEMYMKSYGRSNTMQAHVQTNEDNLSEEVQTDEIVYKNKWTQKPVSFETKNQAKLDPGQEIIMFSQNHLGVGSDSLEEDSDAWKERMKVNTVRMNQFISSAGQARRTVSESEMLCLMFQTMLVLLEEGQKTGSNMLNKNTKEIPFSDGFISLGIESVPFLAGRTVSDLQFPHLHSNTLLTVHKKIEMVGYYH
ncbi:hypothetical protein C0J52_13915 [Blattella germanica]|nr:hypothetical protein C0J52_13915 [Blattella germanica]